VTAHQSAAPPVKPNAFADESLAEQLEPIAQKIELLETAAILQIASEAAKIREHFRYWRAEGGYTGYMKRRLGYSSSSAYRLLDVHTRFGGNVSQIWERLPVSAVYLLAAPSTPEEALNEVAERVKAGEKPTCALVTEIIAKAKDIDTEPTGPVASTKPAIESAAADGAAVDHEQNVTRVAAETADGKVILYDWKTGETSVEGDDRADLDPIRIDHVDGAEVTPKADLETLVATWEMSTPEEQQSIRDRVLADFFAQAAGAHIAALIPAPKHADVVRPLLDQLGVDAMLQAMSSEFGRQLRAKLPRKAKPFKTEHAVKTADANGKATYALKGRGSRSRPQA
jgi:hypothetical protein